ncbi:MAG: hypothetical protein KDD21_10530 [Bacteroidetes bacterium]|nr:hypothetical protein [Bacteroidota bacterium]
MVSGSENGSPYLTCEYYKDKLVTLGDYFSISTLSTLGSATYISNKHLLKSISFSGGSPTVYMYEFDEDGKTTKMLDVSGTDSIANTYEYMCD